MIKIWAGLIILGLLSSCGEFTTQLEPGRCKETSDSVQRRSAFILSCANLYALLVDNVCWFTLQVI